MFRFRAAAFLTLMLLSARPPLASAAGPPLACLLEDASASIHGDATSKPSDPFGFGGSLVALLRTQMPEPKSAAFRFAEQPVPADVASVAMLGAGTNLAAAMEACLATRPTAIILASDLVPDGTGASSAARQIDALEAVARRTDLPRVFVGLTPGGDAGSMVGVFTRIAEQSGGRIVILRTSDDVRSLAASVFAALGPSPDPWPPYGFVDAPGPAQAVPANTHQTTSLPEQRPATGSLVWRIGVRASDVWKRMYASWPYVLAGSALAVGVTLALRHRRRLTVWPGRPALMGARRLHRSRTSRPRTRPVARRAGAPRRTANLNQQAAGTSVELIGTALRSFVPLGERAGFRATDLSRSATAALGVIFISEDGRVQHGFTPLNLSAGAPQVVAETVRLTRTAAAMEATPPSAVQSPVHQGGRP